MSRSDYGAIVGRLVMWQAPGAPPIVMQYTDIGEFHREAMKLTDGEGWIEIRRADGTSKPHFEEYIKTSSVIRYLLEVWS